ncbi:aminoglycoside phosphotransferase family protein [Chryseobacterium sp. MFBS3-17]|uniref:aminoglycoside phosphotransferase family protein n=1 Tax=Chryseobacterium sp. MFBS3-17 TaxID=2886689 RepID=UPI001D0E2ADF|nr:phosphotransferase [Chryseobacterium sp. MFBS3-17]MCC2590583.1 phosphotransferase [Chryseobacterium sp. MFBS3-17]
MEEAQQFLEQFTGEKASVFYALPQSGSARRNFVGTSGGIDYIITSNHNVAENECFLYFSGLFSELKLNTPKVYAVTANRTLYIQEHKGRRTLSEIIAEEGLTDRVKALVKQSLEHLCNMQEQTRGKTDYSRTFEYERYDELPVLNDLFYFKSFIADALELPYRKAALIQEFKKIAALTESLGPKSIMLRDFQARNIMVNDSDQVFFIDYQSAMEGPRMYDVISFLYQAKADFPEDFRREMVAYFAGFIENEQERNPLYESFRPLQLIRFLQVLGAYGFRGLVQRKAHFMASVDKGIENLTKFSADWEKMNNFPELKQLIEQLDTPEVQEKINDLRG